MDQALQEANKTIVQFAVDMDLTGGDLSDQLALYAKTFNEASGLEQNLVRSAIKSEYEYLNTLAQVTGGLNTLGEITSEQEASFQKTSESLEFLTETGLLTSEALQGIIDASKKAEKGFSAEEQSSIDKFQALSSGEGTISGRGNNKGREKEINLKELREDLGLGEDASIQDIKDAYIKEYAKNGVLKDDGKGNYRFYGNNENKTAKYNALVALEEELGEYAKYSASQLETLEKMSEIQKRSDSYDPTQEFADYLKNVYEEIGVTLAEEPELRKEQIKQLQLDAEYQKKASIAIYEQGTSMIEKLKEEEARDIKDAEEVVDKAQKDLDKVREEIARAVANGEDTTALKEKETQAIETLTASQDGLVKIQNHYKESIVALEEATLKAAGRMNSTEADEK